MYACYFALVDELALLWRMTVVDGNMWIALIDISYFWTIGSAQGWICCYEH